jgi:hypothetical protein
MPPRLLLALALSLALHAGLLFWEARKLSLPPATADTASDVTPAGKPPPAQRRAAAEEYAHQ